MLGVGADIELHDEIVEWMDSLDDDGWGPDRRGDRSADRSPDHLPVLDGRPDRAADHVRKQRDSERTEIARARSAAEESALTNP